MFDYFVLMTILCFVSVRIYYWYLKQEKQMAESDEKMIVWLTKIYLIAIFVIQDLGFLEIIPMILGRR